VSDTQIECKFNTQTHAHSHIYDKIRSCSSLPECACVSMCKFRSRLLLHNAAGAFNSVLSSDKAKGAESTTLRKIMLNLFIA